MWAECKILHPAGGVTTRGPSSPLWSDSPGHRSRLSPLAPSFGPFRCSALTRLSRVNLGALTDRVEAPCPSFFARVTATPRPPRVCVLKVKHATVGESTPPIAGSGTPAAPDTAPAAGRALTASIEYICDNVSEERPPQPHAVTTDVRLRARPRASCDIRGLSTSSTR